jgi:hypothetical protein
MKTIDLRFDYDGSIKDYEEPKYPILTIRTEEEIPFEAVTATVKLTPHLKQEKKGNPCRYEYEVESITFENPAESLDEAIERKLREKQGG